jgi:hypothetical protein
MKIRAGFAVVALGIWTVFEVWALARSGFFEIREMAAGFFEIGYAAVEIGDVAVGWAIIAGPVVAYVFLLRRTVTSILAGPVLIATRIWIVYVLETSTSSTAGLVIIPALFLDACALGIGVIAEQLSGTSGSRGRRAG